VKKYEIRISIADGGIGWKWSIWCDVRPGLLGTLVIDGDQSTYMTASDAFRVAKRVLRSLD
jgi:hypothetical protein